MMIDQLSRSDMATVSIEHIQTHRYCIFSQRQNCAGFPDERDHPACNCIYVFVNDILPLKKQCNQHRS